MARLRFRESPEAEYVCLAGGMRGHREQGCHRQYRMVLNGTRVGIIFTIEKSVGTKNEERRGESRTRQAADIKPRAYGRGRDDELVVRRRPQRLDERDLSASERFEAGRVP